MSRLPLIVFTLAQLLVVVAIGSTHSVAEEAKQGFRIGIIGLDTSHAIAFTKSFNDEDGLASHSDSGRRGFRVVAAYPPGSPDIASSVSRVPKYTQELRELGIEMVDSIDALLSKVDGVLLETNDGRPHLEQVRPVIAAGKPVFVDKPISGSLTEAVAMFAIARQANVPLFSASSLRFGQATQAVRGGSIGKVTFCETSSPCTLEKTHPDLFWYGIHGVESLFTVMGTGCKSVQRRTEEGKIVVEGTWSGNRTGIFREGEGYRGLAKGAEGEAAVGSYDGYLPLVEQIAAFFQTGNPPVSAAETLEIYAFMEAADESKRRGGQAVKIAEVLAKAEKEAQGLTE